MRRWLLLVPVLPALLIIAIALPFALPLTKSAQIAAEPTVANIVVEAGLAETIEAIRSQQKPPFQGLDERYVSETLLPQLLQEFWRYISCVAPEGRFDHERRNRLTEGRLLCQLYPTLMLGTASAIAQDGARSVRDRFYMMRMLGYLAEGGNTQATGILVRLADDSDPGTAYRAIACLYPADPSCRFKELYLKESREDCGVAVEALSFHSTPEVLDHLKTLVASVVGGSPDRFEVHHKAKEAVERHGILASRDWQAKLRRSILNWSENSEWALEAAMRKPLPNLSAVLRQYLDTSMEAIMKQNLHVGMEPRYQAQELRRLQENYIRGIHPNGIRGIYDEVLVAQSKLGGPLTELEKARLRTFGYGCEPRQRLLELIANHRE